MGIFNAMQMNDVLNFMARKDIVIGSDSTVCDDGLETIFCAIHPRSFGAFSAS